MRSLITRTSASFLTLLLGFGAATTQAQTVFASSVEYASGESSATGTDPGSAQRIVLTGKITNPAGVLPGAVIILTASKQMAVTNADGEFEFVVPANAGPLAARVTYAGFADEAMTLNAADASTVNLANATVVVVARRQQLKFYLKTARKQVNHSLKQVRN